MTSAGPDTELLYAQVHEDPLLELRVIDRLLAVRPRPLRVAMVASGGCTALTLLGHRSVARIEAIDTNPAQLHLVEFKRQALLHLDLDDQLALLGAFDGPEAERLRLYGELRPALPEATRAYWDARADQVAYGLNRVGRFEQRLRALATDLRALGLDPLLHPRDAVLDARFREAFERAFEPSALAAAFGAEAVRHSRAIRFSDHFAEAFSRAMWRYLPEENYFLHQAWADAYPPSRRQLPPYLQAGNQAVVREAGAERLRLQAGDFAATLAALAAEGPFDLVATSNVTDWMPSAGLHGLLDTIRSALAPGGALLARRLIGDHALEAIVSEHLKVEAAFGKELWLTDRSFLYTEVVVGLRS